MPYRCAQSDKEGKVYIRVYYTSGKVMRRYADPRLYEDRTSFGEEGNEYYVLLTVKDLRVMAVEIAKRGRHGVERKNGDQKHYSKPTLPRFLLKDRLNGQVHYTGYETLEA